MSYEIIIRWISLIGGTACVFGLVVIFCCIILKIIITYQKTDKNDDSQSEKSKTEKQEESSIHYPCGRDLDDTGRMPDSDKDIEQTETVITKETQFANVRSILMIAIGFVVVALDFYFSSRQQWTLIFITSLIGICLVNFVSTLGKKNENDRNKR